MALNKENFIQNIQNKYRGTDNINISLENRAKTLFSKLGLNFQKIPTLHHNSNLPDKIEGSYSKENLSLRKNPRVSDKKAEAVAMHELYHHIQKDKGMNLSEEEHIAEEIEEIYLNQNQKKLEEDIDFDLIYAYTIKQFYEHDELDRLVSIFGGDISISRIVHSRAMSIITESIQTDKKNSSTRSFKASNINKVSDQIKLKENKTGLPDKLKGGIESLSGISMDDVRVHYNSLEPEQFNAHGFAKGSDIYLSLGAEKHLPHEAWHIVQQKQGRVKATKQFKNNREINDNQELEEEANFMGDKANSISNNLSKIDNITQQNSIVQLAKKDKGVTFKSTKNGIAISFMFTPKAKKDIKYATLEFESPLTIQGELKFKDSSKILEGIPKEIQNTYNESVTETSNKSSATEFKVEKNITIYKDIAQKEGKDRLQQLIYEELNGYDGFDISKIDLVENAVTGEDKKTNENTASYSLGIKLIYKNGQETLISLKLLELNTTTNEMVVFGASVEHTIKFFEINIWENNEAEFIVNSDVKLIGVVKPNWKIIMANIGSKISQQVGRPALSTLISGITIDILIAGSFVIGGILSIAVIFADLNDLNNILKLSEMAKNAVNSFIDGYCRAFEIFEFKVNSNSDIAINFFNKGYDKGSITRDNEIEKLKSSNPLILLYSEEDILNAVINKAKENPSEFASKIRIKIEMDIYRNFVLSFYKTQKDSLFISNHIAHWNARLLAVRLKVSDNILPPENE